MKEFYILVLDSWGEIDHFATTDRRYIADEIAEEFEIEYPRHSVVITQPV